jgi:mannose-6-phosphate isomerase-like protein (cupin superfamily)
VDNTRGNFIGGVLWMRNIRVLDTGIDVSGVLRQLKEYPEDWGAQTKISGVGDLVDEWGFPKLGAGVLQLVMGAVEREDQFVGDSEMCVPTPSFHRHTEVLKILSRYVKDVSRCGFLSLPVGGKVGTHIDIGSYYQTRDRYHLSIQGKYKYHVGDEEIEIEPGMLIWFNNKLPHGTENTGDVTRITFVFDVKYPELR